LICFGYSTQPELCGDRRSRAEGRSVAGATIAESEPA